MERISELEKQVADFETWNADKQKYELKKVASTGALAYMLKPEARGGEPPHWVCTHCYENRKRSILQFLTDAARDQIFKCPSCCAVVTTHGEQPVWL